MATSTFERQIELKSPELVNKLKKLMSDEKLITPISHVRYSRNGQDRGKNY